MHDDEAAPKEDRDEAEVYEAPAVEIALTDKDLEREVHYAGNGSL